MSACEPLIMQVQRCSLHDGGGIRTVVYFKGCTLRCIWCHNPEGQQQSQEIFLYAHKCIGCGRCAALCPDKHILTDNGVSYVRRGCTACGGCAAVCPTRALSLCGVRMTADELIKCIAKDRHYFQSSGGGVTFSGGEALMYPEFLAELLGRCRAQGIHTAVESALHVPLQSVRSIAPLADFWMADIKHMDPAEHKRLTGATNELVLGNIEYLAAHARLLARMPLIPGCNDSVENLQNTAKFALECGAEGLELLKYNPLGAGKYAALGRTVPFEAQTQSNEIMQDICKKLNGMLGRDFVFFNE